jgi:hypothetical protein
MIEARDASHAIVHRDEYAYCAHPHVVVCADGDWLVVFNMAPRRRVVLHPPEEPLFCNMTMRSADRGASWSAPQIVPGYGHRGTECAGLTVLGNGTVLLSQWLFDWFPIDLARSLKDQSPLTYPQSFMKTWLESPEHDGEELVEANPQALAQWVRGQGQTWIHRSADDGRSFTHSTKIDTGAFSGGYCMRSGVELGDGTLLLLLSDVPNYRQVFCVRSCDGGKTWTAPSLVAAGDGHAFEEPASVLCQSGKILAIMRDNCTRHLHQVESTDGGRTWSHPQRLAIEGYPPHLLSLGDSRLLLTYGWRQPDFGIHAVVSHDEGNNWETNNTFVIRTGLPNKDLGYPATIRVNDEWFYTVYYAEDASRCSCIMATLWRLQ